MPIPDLECARLSAGKPARFVCCTPDPVAPKETELWVFTRNPFGHIVGRIDLTAPDADERLARYDETAEA